MGDLMQPIYIKEFLPQQILNLAYSYSIIKYSNQKQFNIDEYDYLMFGCKLLSWCEISSNPNAVELIKNNQDKIDWHLLSANPAIFVDEPMPI